MTNWWLKCVEHHRFLSLTTIFWYGVLLIWGLVLPAARRYQHAQTKLCQTSTAPCLSFTVFHLLDDSSSFVFTLHFLMSESLPYSAPLGFWNRPSVGGQRVSSDRNPRTLCSDLVASDPCCALGVLPPLLLSEQVLTDVQVNAQRPTVTFPPEWNQNTGPGPLLMECQMPAVRGAARERWKTAIYHGRWGSRSASGDCPT